MTKKRWERKKERKKERKEGRKKERTFGEQRIRKTFDI
jgi:hypothetical protein